MNETQVILVIGIALVIFYDFTNGFHDAADMVATAIASHSITPGRAIAIVTFLEGAILQP